MNILVLIKQVPDTETQIVVKDGKVDENGIKWIISPYDENALEEAVQIKEKTGASVTAITLGNSNAVSVLRTAYAIGATNAILVEDENYEMLDAFTIAEGLMKAIEGENFDLILTGRTGTDSNNGQVPLIMATKMDLPIVNIANKIEVADSSATVECEVEGGIATMEVSFPAMITANDRLNEPRYPSLKGIMAAKKKKIDTKKLADLGVSGKKIELLNIEEPPARPAGTIIEGNEPEDKAKALVDALHNQEKVI